MGWRWSPRAATSASGLRRTPASGGPRRPGWRSALTTSRWARAPSTGSSRWQPPARAGLAGADLGLDEVPVVDPYFGGISVPAVRSGDWAAAGYPHGTLLVARLACLEQVGLFDEAYFAYCEEADLALRARARGWLSGQVWGATARNTGLGSEEVSRYLRSRNTLHLVRRWFGSYRAAVRLGLEVPAVTRDRPSRLAVRDFLLGRWGPPPRDLGNRGAT